MRGVCRMCDMSMGSDGCCPIVAVGSTASGVLINGRQPMLVGDRWGAHPCGGDHCHHSEYCTTGSSILRVNGKPVVLTCMALSGDTSGTGSPNVLVGG